MVDMLAATRLRAIKMRPYFATALFALHLVRRPGLGTFAIDKWGRVYIDPDKIGRGKDQWNVEIAAWALIHELGHWLRKHHARAEPLLRTADCAICDPALINIAEDAELNDDLVAEGAKIPKDWIYPKTIGQPDGKLFEEYYAELKKPHKHPPGGGGSGKTQSGGGTGNQSGGGSKRGGGGKKGSGQQQKSGKQDGPPAPKFCDRHQKEFSVNCGSGAHSIPQEWEEGPPGQSDVPGIRDGEGEMLRKQVAKEVVDHAGRHPGTMPAGLLRWAESLLEPPQVPWERELAALVRNAVTMAAGCVDYSYTRPSRRGNFNGIIMPSLRRPKPEVSVVLDTSGSMDRSDLRAALSEIRGIVSAIGQLAVPVICCDADAAPVQRVSNAMQIELIGGGGTNMGVGIDAAVQLGSEVIVVLTDGYTPWPAEPPRGRQLVIGLIRRGADKVYEDDDYYAAPKYAKRVLHIHPAGRDAEAA